MKSIARRRFGIGTTDPDDCEIVIYGGANQPTCTCFLQSARWMKRYSHIWRSAKQSGSVTSAIKHDADASQLFHQLPIALQPRVGAVALTLAETN